MKVLVLNCGSSSIKYKLFEMDTKEILAQGGIEKIGLRGSFLKINLPNGEKITYEKNIPEHTAGIEFILKTLTSPEYGAIKSLDEIDAVGHRVVHGGEAFSKSVLIDKEVTDMIVACSDLAPIHNPANLKGINAISEILPDVPQVAVFDTAFHQTMPDYAYMYAIPYELYDKYGVRRYGFHGTSHRYVSQRVCDFLGVQPEGLKIITCHIGNGGSISAIKDGMCIDTTMGLTPLEGLMMGTRSGDIDAGAVTFIMDKDGDEQGVIGQQGRDGTVVEQPPHHPCQRGGGDQKATHCRPPEADAVLRPERGARQDGAQHPAALPQDYGGADAAEQQEQGEDYLVHPGRPHPAPAQDKRDPHPEGNLQRVFVGCQGQELFRPFHQAHSGHQQQGHQITHKRDGHQHFQSSSQLLHSGLFHGISPFRESIPWVLSIFNKKVKGRPRGRPSVIPEWLPVLRRERH